LRAEAFNGRHTRHATNTSHAAVSIDVSTSIAVAAHGLTECRNVAKGIQRRIAANIERWPPLTPEVP
jgi:hypothetical protein